MIIVAKPSSPRSATMPMANCIPCRFVVRRGLAMQLVLRRFGKPVARFAAHDLPYPRVVGLFERRRRAVEDHLLLALLEPGQGKEHYDSVGDLPRGVHVVSDDDA